MRKLIYTLGLLLAVGAVGCGDDGPDIPRGRDYQFSVFELFHIGAEQPSVSLQSCDITVHRQTSTADMVIRLDLGGAQVTTFTLQGIALTYDYDENRYTARTAATGDPRVTDFAAVIDCNDYIAEMSFKLDGTVQVAGTSNELFYSKSRTAMTYSDQSTYTDPYASYILVLHPEAAASSMTIGNLLHKKDVITYKHINLEGLKMSVTAAGYELSGDNITCEKGEYSRPDYSTGSPTSTFGDSLFLRFENLKAQVNLIDNSMTGSWTMVRLKRVTDTIQKTPEVRKQVREVEVGRTVMNTQGSIY